MLRILIILFFFPIFIYGQTTLDLIKKNINSNELIKELKKVKNKSSIFHIEKGENTKWSGKGSSILPIPMFKFNCPINYQLYQKNLENIIDLDKEKYLLGWHFIVSNGKYNGRLVIKYKNRNPKGIIYASNWIATDSTYKNIFDLIKFNQPDFIFGIYGIAAVFLIKNNEIKVIDIVEPKVYNYFEYLKEKVNINVVDGEYRKMH